MKDSDKHKLNRASGGAGVPDSLLYANIKPNSRRYKKEAKKIDKAHRLASMPKGKFKRVLYYLNPKNFWGFVFSKRGIKLIGKLAVVTILILSLVAGLTFAYFRRDINKLNPEEISRRIQNSSVKYYDNTGSVLLWEYKGDKDRTVVEYGDISDDLKHATIALEDRNFYNHKGFDPKGLSRALIGRGERGGGSTITQQLVKNELLEDNQRTLSRKAKELILAVEVERTYSKEQILTMYLNSVNYGGTSYGIESGAQRYFGKSAKDLSLGESVFLASIPQLPSVYDPYSQYFNQDALEARMNAALKGMVEVGYITQDQANAVDVKSVLDTVKPEDLSGQYKDIKAPHFVLEVQNELFQKYGEQNVRKGGYEVVTSLDWDLQQKAEEAVSRGMSTVESYSGSNASLVSVDVASGKVLAMVGSRDFNYPGYGAFNVATSNRQPGSSIKPFTYAQLFYKDNWGAGSTILDTPKTWPGYSTPPKNADGRFFGPITVREALDTSRNLPALKAIEITGVDPMIDLARQMGDQSLCNTCDYGLSVTLGSGEVKLSEHTQAYAAFARGGIAKPSIDILKVKKSNGDVLEEWKDQPGQQVLNPENAYLINDILSDVKARSRVFGGLTSLMTVPGVKSSVKTGTTNDDKDGWMMGYTPIIATGVWVGNNDNASMSGGSATSTGTIWSRYMREAYSLKGWKDQDFNRPSGIQELTINGRKDIYPSWFKKPKELPGKEFTVDKVSKKLATNCTPESAKEVIKATGIDVGEGKVVYNAGDYDLTKQDDLHSCGDPKPTASLSASSPPANPPVSASNPKTVNFTLGLSPGKFNINNVEIIIDGQSIGSAGVSTSGSSTFTHAFTSPGSHTITVNITDEGYYSSTINQTVNIQ